MEEGDRGGGGGESAWSISPAATWLRPGVLCNSLACSSKPPHGCRTRFGDSRRLEPALALSRVHSLD